jgi:hypothetical protein
MIINPYSFGGLDPDAQSFLTASGITDSTISSAINTLVTTMKSDGIWTKMKAIYPMVGGTAFSHKWNLKDPQDTNAAFRLSFIGGWTHNANGAKPNGTNGYAETFFNPSLHSLQNSHHFSVYLKQSEIDKIPFGATSIGVGLNGGVIIPRLSGQTYYGINQNGYSPTYGETNSIGFYVVTRTASNVSKVFKSNILKATSTSVSNTPQNVTYYIGHWNTLGSVTYYSASENAFTSIGEGLNDTEAANFYTAVQAFQTTLNRQIV